MDKRFLILGGVIALALAGCDGKSEIKVYRVSKAPLEESASDQQDAMPANAPTPSMPGGMGPTGSTVSVPAPPNWQPQPLSQMRQASFLVKGDKGAVADISFVSLGASAGSVLENVNRWLSQIGQPPINEEKLNQIVQHLTTSIGDITVVDLAGLPNGADPAKDGRIIAAMTSASGSTLFFKIRGNAALTESQKGNFVKWVTAVCNTQGGSKSQQAASAMPSMENLSNPPVESPSNSQIKWQLPTGWSEVPPSAMRYASFSAGANDSKVDISIVTFNGDGGSDTDNVNRWRQQIGLPPMTPAAVATQVESLKGDGAAFSIADIAGPNARTLAAWTRRDGHVWFVKASGPSAAVGKEKPNFVKFVQSVRF
ncbi:MAG TPA: hypothetical protein VLK27_06205 [Chthoniobacterales bacterium]|nr:hypothetical protein [Chthoniobacterales bacterium]